MRKCNRCGAESNDEAQFCYKCGSSMTVGSYQTSYQPPRLYSPEPPRPQKRHETDSILAVVLVIVLVAGLIIGAVVISSAMDDMNWNEGHDIDMTVSDQSDYSNTSDPPIDGYRYVVLTVIIHNDGDNDLSIGPEHFLLYTSDDNFYAWAPAAPETVPSTIDKGETDSFTIGFMIPEDSIPSVLELDTGDFMFGDVRTAVPS